MAWYTLLNHDIGVFLVFAERILAGDRLYTDIVDPNLPAMMWLALIPVTLSKITALSPAAAFFASYYILLLTILWTTWLSLRPFPWMQYVPARRAAVVALTFTVFFTQGGQDFGQRVIFAMNYLPNRHSQK